MNYITFYRQYLDQGRALSKDEFIQEAQTRFELNLGEIHYLEEWYHKVFYWSHIQNYIQRGDIDEILHHGNQSLQLVEKGSIKEGPLDLPWPSLDEFQLSLENLALQKGIPWNFADPFVSFHHQMEGHQFRVGLFHYSLSPYKVSKIFWRRNNPETFDIKEFGLDSTQERIICNWVKQKKNLIICGKTGSGKTSFLKALLPLISSSEHLAILEDTHEINYNRSFCTHFLGEGRKLLDFTAFTLRIRPDRIIFGEIRQKEMDALLMILNTGHQGLLCTLHSDGAEEALHRMSLIKSVVGANEGLSYQTLLGILSRSIDKVFYLEDRKVKKVISIHGQESGRLFYEEEEQFSKC